MRETGTWQPIRNLTTPTTINYYRRTMSSITNINDIKDRNQDRENLARQLRTTQMMREMAREQINPTDIITALMEIDASLQGETDLAGNPIPLDRDMIAMLRARADIKFRMLSKVLPDLKATESISHSTHDHQHLVAHANVSNMELAQRLQLWRRDHLPDSTDPNKQDDILQAKEQSSFEATYARTADTDVEEVFDFL